MYCRKCGKELIDTAKFCPLCGTAAAKSADNLSDIPSMQKPTSAENLSNDDTSIDDVIPAIQPCIENEIPTEETRSQRNEKHFGGVTASIILSFLLVISGLLVVPTLFARTFAEDFSLILNSSVTSLLSSLFPIIFVCTFMLLLIVDIFIVNRNRIRLGFLFNGISFAVMGVTSIALSLFTPALINLMGENLKSSLTFLKQAFCDVQIFLGICLFVFGILIMAIYACIGAIIKEGGNAS